MEHVTIILDDGTGKEFDARVRGHGVLPSGQDLTVVTKNKGTVGGKPIVLLTFTVELPDKMRAKAQVVTTAENIMGIAAALRGKYNIQ